MKQTTIYIIILFFLSILNGCKKQIQKTNQVHIDIDNISNNTSIFDIFETIEVIPLETIEASLIQEIKKVVYFKYKYYIFDRRQSQVFIFNQNGKFISKIENKGLGPNQYIDVSDFDIDKENNKILLLSTIKNELHEYDIKGDFLQIHNLPLIKDGPYVYMKCINSDVIAFWTYDYNNRLKIYSKNKNRFIHEDFPETRNFYGKIATPVFPYKNYLTRSIDNNVYEISQDGKTSIAYTWDFGKLNISLNKLKIPSIEESNPKEIMRNMEKAYSSEIINYFFGESGGNSDYIYTRLIRKNRHLNIFYNKKTKTSCVFEKTRENAYFYPIYWVDDFVIGFKPNSIYTDNKETLPDMILDEENIKKKKQHKEFDNPILVKYYFKKK